MATIQDLYEKLVAVEGRVSEIKKQIKGSTDRNIAKANKALENARETERTSQETIDKITAVEEFGLSIAQKEARVRARNDLAEAQRKIREQEEALVAMDTTGLRESLAELESEQDEIISEFAANPIINEAIKLKIQEKFLIKIAKAEKEVETTRQEQTDFNKALTDETLLKPAVEKVQRAYAELTSVVTLATSTNPADLKKFAEKQAAYLTAAQELRSQSRVKFTNIAISEDMLRTIAAGTATTYELKPLDDLITKLEAEHQGVISSRDKALQKLEAAKGIGTAQVDTSEIDDKIAAEEAKKQPADDEIAAKQDELNEIEQYFVDLPVKKAELAELEEKAKPDQDKKDAADAAKTAVDAEMAKVKAAGYISRKTVPELKDADSDISKMFKTFTEKDKALRQAFLDIQGENTPEARARLDKAIEEYKNVSKDLADKSGFTIEDWNDYLMRNLNAKIEKGETIDEVYYSDTATSRLDQIAKEHKLNGEHIGLKEVRTAMGAIENLKQDILLGKKDGSKAEVNAALSNYTTKMEALASTLTVSAANLFSKIKAPVQKTVGFFKGLWNKIVPPKVKQLQVRTYNQETKDAASALGGEDGLIAKLKKAEKERDDSVASNLTEDDKTRKADLEAEIGEEATMTIKKAAVERALQAAKDDRTQIDTKIAELQTEKAEAIARGAKPSRDGVSNPEEYEYRKSGKKLVDAAVKRMMTDDELDR